MKNGYLKSLKIGNFELLQDYRPVLPEHVPTRKVIEILATDDDDRSKGNGPPFYFRMDPNTDDEIRDSFKVEHEPSKDIS